MAESKQYKKGMWRLTDRDVRNAKKQLSDGGGLSVVPRGEGGKRKTWVFRYTSKIHNTERKPGLGSYPDVSLAEAREISGQYRKWHKAGLDPLDELARIEKEKEALADAKRQTPTFVQAAARYILVKRHEWSNRKHAHQWVATLRTYAKPVIGDMPVNEVTTDDVERILKPIWLAKTETAKRVQTRIEKVLDWATVKKHRAGDNPARWKGNLDELFPAPSKIKKINNNGEERHHPSMHYKELATFWGKLSKKNSDPKKKVNLSAKALQFLILTACRSGEVLNATWDEIDLEGGLWVIPARRMKAGKEHRVPLTEPMIEVLESLPRLSEYVFPGQGAGRPLSGMAMLMLMRKMEFGHYVPHGFRSSFRDWAEEQANYPIRVVEKALAHTVKSSVERAYQRGDLFDKRRLLMESWGNYFTINKESSVVPFSKSA
jgi:integrase